MTSLLRARGLVHRFPPRAPGEAPLLAVDGVDLDIFPGEVLGLVGESGSGKTTLGKLLLRVLQPQQGSVHFDGEDLLAASPARMRDLRSRMQMVYQSASASLNPGLTVRQHLAETIHLHRRQDAPRCAELIEETLLAYGLQGMGSARPSQLSGGQRRRVSVARSLLPHPGLVVADEPTAGLDAPVKSDVLDAMLQTRSNDVAWLFISHDLDIVRYVADRVLVMHRGRIVQEMPASFLDPRREAGPGELHPYTERLLSTSFNARGEPIRVPDRAPSDGGCAYRSLCHGVDPEEPLWQMCTLVTPDRVPLSRGGSAACHRLERLEAK